MSGVRNFLARRDGFEERLPSNEQTQKVQLALKSLNPSFTRLQSRGLSHRSSVPSFFSSTPPTSPTKEAPQQKKAHRSPPPALNIHHPAQRHSWVVDSPTSSSATVTPPQNYLPMPSALLLDLPLLPLTPPPMSPATRKRRRFSMLSRKLGEAIPPELIFGADHVDLETKKGCDGIQKNAKFGSFAPATSEGAACVLHISSANGRGGDHHRPSVPLARGARGRDTQQNCTTWTLERNGRRVNIEQHDYQDVLEHLRKL